MENWWNNTGRINTNVDYKKYKLHFQIRSFPPRE